MVERTVGDPCNFSVLRLAAIDSADCSTALWYMVCGMCLHSFATELQSALRTALAGWPALDERADLCRAFVMAMFEDLWPAHWAMTESKMPIDIARLLGAAVPALPPPARCALQQAHAERQPAVTKEAGAQHAQQPAPRAAMQRRRLRSSDDAKGTGLAGGDRLEIQVDAGSSAILRPPTRARPLLGDPVGQSKHNKAAETRIDDARNGQTAALQRPASPTGSGRAAAPGPPSAAQEGEVTLPTTLLADF